MRRTNRIFSPGERRMALAAVVVVAAVITLALTTGGIFSPSTGTGNRAGYGFADLPGVADAQPLVTN
jgi:hypothetical protein